MSNPQTNAQSVESMRAEIERLKAEIKTQRQSQGNLSLKVSEKGAISVYGMGKFPVTLYAEQWDKLSKLMPQLLSFAEENKARLKTKASPQLAAV